MYTYMLTNLFTNLRILSEAFKMFLGDSKCFVWMDGLQNEANPFIKISQTQIWTKTVQNIFYQMLGLIMIIIVIHSG